MFSDWDSNKSELCLYCKYVNTSLTKTQRYKYAYFIVEEYAMDLNKWEVFNTVIACGSLTAAADICGYSASGISRLIASLEEEVGFRLLLRRHEGVYPTKECEQLLPVLQELLHRKDIFLQTAANISGAETGTITIGMAYSRYYEMITSAAQEFQKLHPGVSFRYVQGYSSELLEQLNNHTIDLCLISQREGDHDWIKTGTEEMVAWIPKHWPEAKKKSVSLSFFEQQRYIDIYPGKDVDNARIFKSHGIIPNIYTSAEDSYSVYCMVEAGIGVSMNHRSTSSHWNGNVAIVPIKPVLRQSVGIASSAANRTPVTDAFLTFFKQNKKQTVSM